MNPPAVCRKQSGVPSVDLNGNVRRDVKCIGEASTWRIVPWVNANGTQSIVKLRTFVFRHPRIFNPVSEMYEYGGDVCMCKQRGCGG